MNKLFIALAIAFFSFILWVIYHADAGQPTFFHLWITTIPFGDKIGHVGLFGTLAYLSNFALKLRQISLAKFNVYLGTLLVFSFALIEEISQLFFPQRTFDWFDLLAGVLGIFVANFATKTLANRQNHTRI